MKIVIFGANGPTGRLLTKQALTRGHLVTAVTRHPEDFPLKSPSLQLLHGDVYDYSSVERAVEGQDAVLSTLGVPFNKKEITVYSKGIGNIIKAMTLQDVHRLVCVSSSAVDPSHNKEGGFIFNKIIQPFILKLGRTLYEDMRRMEEVVTKSSLDWTIIRPSGLIETTEITPYQVKELYTNGRFTSRTDLADFMLQQLDTNKYVRKIMAVVTISVKPSILKLILKEALQHK
jgi:putative NADH-flavin reductase